jgi:hypothetical protein
MNKSGRSRAASNPFNTLVGLAVLDSFSDNADCLFLHLRENPSLCNRHRGKVAKAQSTHSRSRKRKALVRCSHVSLSDSDVGQRVTSKN